MSTVEFQAHANSEGAGVGASPELAMAAARVLSGDTLAAPPPIVLSADEAANLHDEFRGVRDRQAATLAATASRTQGQRESILRLLKKGAIQPNIIGFDDATLTVKLRHAIDVAVSDDRPIALALPMGGSKTSNSLKSGRTIGPDLAEWSALANLDAMVLALREIHPPGATLIVMPDAGIHTADLSFPIESTMRHLDRLEHLLGELSGADRIMIADPLAFLPPTWNVTVERIAGDARRAFDSEPHGRLRALADSLVYSLNTGVNTHEFGRDVLVYAAVAGAISKGLPADIREEAAALYRRAERVVPHYVGVNQAIREVGLLEGMVEVLRPGAVYVRLSVHAKRGPGEPRPMLIQTGRYALKPGLLPMHALGVRAVEEGVIHHGLVFEVAARVRGWTPVLDVDGHFLYYNPTGDGSTPSR